MDIPKIYNAKDHEADIYRRWEDAGAFKPRKSKGEPFVVTLPPPNATGTLHLGHSMMIALEDIMVRYWRMKDRETLWVPGTDHAAIATWNTVIKKLVDERHIADPKTELGRENLLEEIHAFVENSRDTIRGQIRSMGASVDWSRERYTMEPSINRIVNEVFIKMHKDGLIYRGHRIVNWDPKLQTTVSDDEVDRIEETASFYTFQYGPFQIGTARPETKFGDKYVVVHPDDNRYKKWKDGEEFEVEWINGKIKATLIKDSAVDPEFGTGAMTITPWHDATDFEIAERHKLDKEPIIDKTGHLLPIAGDLAGLSIDEAREKVVKMLDAKGLLVSTDENYTHNVAVNSRGRGIIEPQIMLQWFVDVNKPVVAWNGSDMSLKQVMKSVVEEGQIEIIPKRFEKVYYHWIENLHDWCISRQIWWGHRIPVWYKGELSHVGIEPPHVRKGEVEKGWEQDPDTLDTWFSSALWTWSTLIDSDKALDPKNLLENILKHSPDFQRYHPTTVLETGYDILFFWVARMILSTTYTIGEVPFKKVYLHGMVRTRDGEKMSKSKPETTIDPLEIIPEYGADALRLAMTLGMGPGSDTRLYKEKIAGYRNFCNKLWNVSRYVLSQIEPNYKPGKPRFETDSELWILSRLNKTINIVSEQIEAFRFSDAGQAVYQFLWNDFADWYLEINKVQPNIDVLTFILEKVLALAHPFAPFVTETVWDYLPHKKDLLISSQWPIADDDDISETEFEQIRTIVNEVRNLKTEFDIAETTLYHKESNFLDINRDLIKHLTGLKGVRQVTDGRGLYLTQTDLIAWLDVEENATRDYLMKLITQRSKLNKQKEGLQSRLANHDYMKKAPKELIDETKSDYEEINAHLSRLDKKIETTEQSIQEF